MSLKNLTQLSLLCIVSMSFSGCVKEPLVSISAKDNSVNEGIIYYLPENVYWMQLNARLIKCGEYTDTEITQKPDMNITAKLNIATIADEGTSYTAMPQTFGGKNDNFSTFFVRSPNGLLVSVNTTNDNKTAEVVTNYVSAAASIALAWQTGGLSLSFPKKIHYPALTEESAEESAEEFIQVQQKPKTICKDAYKIALTRYDEEKNDYEKNSKELAKLSKKRSDIVQEINNTERAKAKGLKALLDQQKEIDNNLSDLNKTIAKNHETMVKLDKQLTFTASIPLFDTSKKQEKYQQTVDLSKLFNQVFTNEFNEITAAKITEESNSIVAKMTDSNGNILIPNNVNASEINHEWPYHNKEIKGFNGIVYRDWKNAYLEITRMDRSNKKDVLFGGWVPFRQGGKIGVAPIYNWSGKGSSSVKFDENGSLIEYKAEITESSGEKSSSAAKTIGSTVQNYSEKNMALEKTQLQHELDLLKLKQEIKDIRDQLNKTP